MFFLEVEWKPALIEWGEVKLFKFGKNESVLQCIHSVTFNCMKSSSWDKTEKRAKTGSFSSLSWPLTAGSQTEGKWSDISALWTVAFHCGSLKRPQT